MRRSGWILATIALAAGIARCGEATIAPPDSMVLDGIPPIPATVAEAVGRYAEFRAAGLFSWHPVRREMLIATRFAETTQVHWVRSPGGARKQLTFFRERILSASFPRRSDRYFVFTKDVGGDEFAQIYRYDLEDGGVTRISDGGRSQNGLGPWSHAGDRMAYGTTRRNGKDRDLHVIDPLDPRDDRCVVELEGGGWRPADWSPDDRTILLVEYVSINESHLWLVDVASGGKRRLTPEGGAERVAYEGPRFGDGGKAVYVATDRDSEFLRLARIDFATGEHTYLTPDIPWDVDGFDLSPDGGTIAFVTNEEGWGVLRLLDGKGGGEIPVPRIERGIIGGLSWHENGRDLAFSLSNARSPSDVYSLDVAAGKVERWTESEIGGLVPSSFPEPELIRWKSFDGRMIPGFLYRPAKRFGGKRPVIIHIHGGPEGQKRPGFLGRDNLYLDEMGIALIYPNVRGSSGYGKTFLALDDGYRREDAVKDIGALLDWIRGRPDLDASRVMVMGGSYGGYMTLASATHFDDRIRCSLDVVGISNFVTFLERTEPYRRDLRRVEYGDERDPKMREFLLRISPANNARKITKPIFIVQGRNDPRVPWTESEQMVATLKEQGTPVWYLMAKDEGHGFSKKKNAEFYLLTAAMFVREHLLGGGAEATAPRIPVIHSTDLHHPPNDPDDHYDLASAFALEEFDVKAIILDLGAVQAERMGKPAVEQMMRIAGRRVPYAIGLRDRLESRTDLALDEPPEFQAGVELILSVLRESKEKVIITTTGSCRDIAVAYNREPDLLKEKVRALYFNIGRGPNEKQDEYNVGCDPIAYLRVFETDLPLYWCPCFGKDGYETHYVADQTLVVGACAPRVRNYFVYCLTRSSEDPLAFLDSGPHPLPKGPRHMWCTAPMFHAAGRRIYARGPEDYVALSPAAAAKAGLAGEEVDVYRFVPVRATIEDGPSGPRLRATLDPAEPNARVFRRTDDRYGKILESCLKNLLGGLGR
ncbi:MAG: prolyl oligopeptidase family serine peptidase [Planctomycetes bacterium]|nr:prolyl oligopeptidase family serine peptidase [Planctomycetota bacterium]